MSVIDDYLKTATPSQRTVLNRIREIIKEIVPEAEEVISYGVPCFKYNKSDLIYIAAFKNHMSIYPASDEMVKELGEKVGKFRVSKGTLRFTEANPIPEPVIKQIVQFSLKRSLNK